MLRHFDVQTNSVNTWASSNGDQRKWRYTTDTEDIFIKEQLSLKRFWKDNLVEVIASRICSQLNADWLRYAEYALCEIDDGETVTKGCYSHNFLKQDEELVTMYNMMRVTDIALSYNDSITNIYLKLLNTMTEFGIEHAT